MYLLTCFQKAVAAAFIAFLAIVGGSKSNECDKASREENGDLDHFVSEIAYLWVF